MTTSELLSDFALEKARRYMRALRRAILSYWYATIEDRHAALIEAANACLVVNILDESVFEADLDGAYRKLRSELAGGQVVAGLELIRNCETHSPITFDDLLIQRHLYSVPLQRGGQVMRSVWHWARYTDLPPNYVELSTTDVQVDDDELPRKMRARKEAQHAYRQGIQGRSVIETLFDAERFFVNLEPRLTDGSNLTLKYSFAEVPLGEEVFLYRPLEHFTGTGVLPDLVTRWYERIAMSAPPADQYVENLASSKNRDVPTGEKRVISHKIPAEGKTIAYSGYIETAPGRFSGWVERSAQIGRDIRAGFPYVVKLANSDVLVTSSDNLALTAPDTEGRDLLAELPEAEKEQGAERLRLVEEYPDLYLAMRNGL